jgi:DNA-binding transcriptional regulator LsrR (DeoR family)
VRGEARFLPVPGIVDSARAAKVLLQDSNVSNTLALFEKVTLALVGVGTLEPSSLVASSGNIFSKEELESLQNQGRSKIFACAFMMPKVAQYEGVLMTG